MAVKTLMLAAGQDGNYGALVDGVDQTAATRTDGWTVAKIASLLAADFDAATKQASGTFVTNTTRPSTLITSTTANALKTPAALNGVFANTAWTFTFAVRAVGAASAQAGRMRLRVFRSVNADGSSATEITGATQVGTTSAALSTTADVTTVVTWTPGAAIQLRNEYLFFAIAWEITTASGSNSGDVVLRTGQASGGSRVVTSDFGANTTVSKTLALSYNVVGRISKTVVLAYNVKKQISKTVVPAYNVISKVTKTLALSYYIGIKTYSAIVLGDGPTGYWRMDDAGSTAVDTSGSGNDLTDGGATTTAQVTGLLANDPTSKARGFSAANTSFVSHGGNIYPLNTFSVEMWVKRTRTGVGEILFSNYNGGLAFSIWTDGTLYLAKSFVGVCAQTSTLKITDTNTHHIVVTRNGIGGAVTFYLDGVPETPTPTNPSYDFSTASGNGLFIGSEWGSQPVDGTLDEIAIYPTVLSYAKVSNHYAAGKLAGYEFAVRNDAPIAYFRLGESSGTSAVNEVGSPGTYSNVFTLGQTGKISGNTAALFNNGEAALSSFSLAAGNSITVEFFIYELTADIIGGAAFECGTANSGTTDRCMAHLPYLDKVLYWDYGNTGAGGRVSADFTAYLDKWSMVQLTFDSVTGKHAISLDGVEVASGVSSNAPTITLSGMRVGRGAQGAVKAVIDEFAIYDYALTPTQRLAHFNATALPSVSKTVALNYNVGASVAKTLALTYSVRKQISKTVTPAYTVRKAIAQAVATSYTVKKTIVKAQAFSYNVRTTVALKTLALTYNVKKTIAKTVALNYTVKAAVVKTAALTYNVIRQISKTLALTYKVNRQISKTAALTYNVQRQISKTAALTYSVRKQISTTVALSYAITVASVTVLDDFNRADSSTLGSNWTSPLTGFHPSPTIVSNQVHSATTNLEHSAYWNVDLFSANHNAGLILVQGYTGTGDGSTFLALSISGVGSAFTGYVIDFHSLNNGSHDTAIVIYRGNAGSYTSLGTSATFSWAANDHFFAERIGNVINAYVNGVLKLTVTDSSPIANGGRIGFGLYSGDNSVIVDNFDGAATSLSVSKTVTPSYGITGRVVKTLAVNYNVKKQIPKTLALAYKVNRQITKTLVPGYTVVGRISKTVTLSYNVRKQISQSKVLAFNILSLSAVAKSISLAYNVRISLAKPQAFSYNLRKSIAKTLALSYNVRISIAKALSPSYFVRKAIAKAVAPSYNVIGRVAKTLALTFNVSSSGIWKPLTLNYKINKLVVKTASLNYNVQVRVTVKSVAPAYFVRRAISKTAALSYTVRKPAIKTLATAYNVRAKLVVAQSVTYFVRVRISKTLVLTYAVRLAVFTVPRNVSFSYNVRKRISSQVVVSYVVHIVVADLGNEIFAAQLPDAILLTAQLSSSEFLSASPSRRDLLLTAERSHST